MTNEEIAAAMKVSVENVVEAKRLLKLYRQRLTGKDVELQQALDAYEEKHQNQHYYTRELKLLQILNRLLEGSGVESFELETDTGTVYCSYVNTGDPYSLTVVSCKALGILDFMTYADVIEQYEVTDTEDEEEKEEEEEDE